MSDIFGTAIITVDGYELQSIEGSATLRKGLSVGKVRKGPRGYAGTSVVPNTSELTCDVLPRSDFDVEERLANGKETTVRFEDENSGQGWIIPIMVMTEDPELTDGPDAKYSLTLAGSKAEKV
jgi:hypothetical protein